jgi:hypothetical protein
MINTETGGDRSRRILVVYGRNKKSQVAMFSFLRSIGLNPIEWSQAIAMTGEATPYPGRILDVALDTAQAVVVLFTPDEFVALRPEYADGDNDPETATAIQARPNVLFEAGMAMGRSAERTVLVQLGQHRSFSDTRGRHMVRLTNAPEHRKALAERLRTAGCAVDTSGDDWFTEGDFSPPEPPGKAAPFSTSSTNAKNYSSGQARRQEKLTLHIGEPKENGVGGYSVVGEATNDDIIAHSASLTATFYNSDRTVIGTASGVVMQLESGDTKTFTLTTNDDVAGYAQKKIQIDSLL